MEHNTSVKNDCEKPRRLYGAGRAVAAAILVTIECLVISASSNFLFAYLPLAVVLAAALLGVLKPAPPCTGRSFWRILREAIVWFFALLHLFVIGIWLYFATGFFGFVIDGQFTATVKDADRIVIRDGGGLCHSDPDKEPVLFEITNRAEIAAFNALFEFSGRSLPCKCCGYPGIDWWHDGRRVVISAFHHGRALRVEGVGRDWRVTPRSGKRLRAWLEEHCGITRENSSPRYQSCRMERSVIELEAMEMLDDGMKPRLDDLRARFEKAGKTFPACPCGGEYRLSYDEDGTPTVSCSHPRHD